MSTEQGEAPKAEDAGAAVVVTEVGSVTSAGPGEQAGQAAAAAVRKKRQAGGLLEAFLPNRAVSGGTMRVIVAIQVAVALVVWITSPFKALPQPDEVFKALQGLWLTQ